MDPLFKTLLDIYGSELAVARAFGCSRASHWRKKVPERIALLCHLSDDVPYVYQPSDYHENWKSLALSLNLRLMQ